ncbi:hypothetical protein K9F62_19545 [Desulfovibrio sp. JY]|nr:hypothetical protein K9F62_19545 [Desulfovibrio sp. JY]
MDFTYAQKSMRLEDRIKDVVNSLNNKNLLDKYYAGLVDQINTTSTKIEKLFIFRLILMLSYSLLVCGAIEINSVTVLSIKNNDIVIIIFPIVTFFVESIYKKNIYFCAKNLYLYDNISKVLDPILYQNGFHRYLISNINFSFLFSYARTKGKSYPSMVRFIFFFTEYIVIVGTTLYIYYSAPTSMSGIMSVFFYGYIGIYIWGMISYVLMSKSFLIFFL